MKEWALGLVLCLIVYKFIKIKVEGWLWFLLLAIIVPYFLGEAIFEIIKIIKG